MAGVRGGRASAPPGGAAAEVPRPREGAGPGRAEPRRGAFLSRLSPFPALLRKKSSVSSAECRLVRRPGCIGGAALPAGKRGWCLAFVFGISTPEFGRYLQASKAVGVSGKASKSGTSKHFL